MRLARALLGLLLLKVAAWLFAAAERLLQGAAPAPVMPWRSALLIGVATARIMGAGQAL